MKDYEADYLYEVWRRGGNPDAIDLDEIPRDFDWVWDEPANPQTSEALHLTGTGVASIV